MDKDISPDGALADAIVKRLKAERSIKKNGEPWPEWFAKVITPGRIMWTILAIANVIQVIWLLGVQFRDVQIRLEASDQTADIVKGLEKNTAVQGELTEELGNTLNDLMVQTALLERTTKGLNDRVNATITRGEINRIVNLQLIPRLEKIEKAQTSAAAFSGEK